MEHSHTHSKLVLFILLCMSTCMQSATPASRMFGNESDRLALLDLKKRITHDPFNVMSSWNHSNHFCSWVGVTCNNHSTQRVVSLNLKDQNLVGSLPHSIGNLTFLTIINLIFNKLHGEIPQEMGRLQSLQNLRLSKNSFSGKIPHNISHCTQLKALTIAYNQLIGSIPDQLSSLFNLVDLRVDVNNLTGTIPAWIGNFSSLDTLFLNYNNFHGSIPDGLGRLRSLGVFVLSVNNLSGMIPSSIYNISSISKFAVVENQLQGELPPNLGIILPNLEYFFCDLNEFTGNIPTSLSNASRLQRLDFSDNGLTGSLPAESLGSLQNLVWLNFQNNRLGRGKTDDMNFLSFLTNCTNLEALGLNRNNFGGALPESIANLSTQLQLLTFGANSIYGNIPKGIGNLINLTLLGLEQNYLSGSVPDEIGKLQNLQLLELSGNKFSGPIPSSLGNLTSLTELYMEINKFEGSIPPSLGNFPNLLELSLFSNNLNGTIPKEITGLSALSISLNLSTKYLSGPLPVEVGDLVHLTELDVSENNLSGNIPNTLGRCSSLERLYLGGNEFEGPFPQSFEHLKGLEVIDISRNNFSGLTPEFLIKLGALKYLNLSYNNFEGEVPKEGIFSNATGVSVLGNHHLCSGIPQLRLLACPSKKPHSSRGLLVSKVVIPGACALAFILALSCFFVAHLMRKKSRGKPVTTPSYKDWKSSVSYSELVESTNGFSVENLIGSGSFGSVYKGVLPGDGKVVAVKVLNFEQKGASKSFNDECNALRNTRHRNLLKIITVCASIDNQGNDFKSLVFEFMANGSLDSWLYGRDEKKSQSKRLTIIQRLNIAIDVASALDYLHHHCGTSIVHCDLKPSNVLLDQDMVAHVSDFGLARFLLEASNDLSESQAMSITLKGSIGYIPPEYGMRGQVSILGDVYSYGILLLEMFTGKRPTDDMFKDSLSIHQFTAMAFPYRVMEIVDPSLLLETDDNGVQERRMGTHADLGHVKARRLQECLVPVLQIGLSCCTISPGERMLMNVVVNKMTAIRDSYLKFVQN